jgi:hypothetical protein
MDLMVQCEPLSFSACAERLLIDQCYLNLKKNSDFIDIEKKLFHLNEVFVLEKQLFWQFLLFKKMQIIYSRVQKKESIFSKKISVEQQIFFEKIHCLNDQHFTVLQPFNNIKLYELLLDTFFIDLKAIQIREVFYGIVSGIYLIFHKPTKSTYIGESKDIFARFDQHKKALLLGSHANIFLQMLVDLPFNRLSKEKTSSTFWEDFEFLVFDVSDSLKDKKKRLEAECQLMNEWPGALLNIKGNQTLKRLKTSSLLN